jgi:UDP-glucose 4-epimerase
VAISLVTGGAGFIGSHLTAALLARGDAVRVLDNFSTGNAENLQGLDGDLQVITGDLRDREVVEQAVRGVDQVFHQAAFVSVPASMKDPETCHQVNVQGTLNLLQAAREAGVRRLVLASSAAVYGENEHLPLDESQPPDPVSPYAASKLIDEIYASVYTRAFGLQTVALRYFNVYGPRQPPDSPYAAAIPIFIGRLLSARRPTIFGDGHQVRDFVYVGDVVRANLLAAEAEHAPGEVINICSGQAVSVIDLLQALAEILNCPLQVEHDAPRAGDIYRSLGDPSKAARLLGFAPETTLRDGLASAVEWMRA